MARRVEKSWQKSLQLCEQGIVNLRQLRCLLGPFWFDLFWLPLNVFYSIRKEKLWGWQFPENLFFAFAFWSLMTWCAKMPEHGCRSNHLIRRIQFLLLAEPVQTLLAGAKLYCTRASLRRNLPPDTVVHFVDASDVRLDIWLSSPGRMTFNAGSWIVLRSSSLIASWSIVVRTHDKHLTLFLGH